MGLHVVRWQNGDFSVVQAANKLEAVEMLDEVASVEPSELRSASRFMVHFHLTDDGQLELEGFGEEFSGYVDEKLYPALGELEFSPPGTTEEERSQVRRAVETERRRERPERAPEPETQLGKQMKVEMDLSTSLVNRYVRVAAKERLKNSKPKGKPS